MKTQPVKHDPIVIAFCVSDSFIRHTAVVIASILASNPKERFVFHVLCGDLSADNRAKLATMESEHVSIVCHDVAQEEERALPTLMEQGLFPLPHPGNHRCTTRHLFRRGRSGAGALASAVGD